MSRKWLLFCLLLSLWMLPPASLAKKSEDANSKAKHLVDIPVFFITDRNREPKRDKDQLAAFGKFRQYTGYCNHDPYVGMAYCTIENTRGKKLTPELLELGWKEAGKKRVEGATSVSIVEGCTYEEAKDTFYDGLAKKGLLSDDRSVFVFTPGYMSTFNSGLKEAARFAYYSERPVLLFSWPSKGTFKGYTADEASIEWSQDHYNEMIEELAEIATKHPLQIRLLAHSMGSRLLLRASPLIRSKRVFSELAFVCPDVDDGVVKHYILKCLDRNGQAMIRLYMSHKDEMLKLSQLVHGGYARLGEEEGVLDPSPYKKGEKPVTAQVPPEAAKRFQTIDFTAMDTGTLGHKIPVALITNLSLKNVPPEDIPVETKEKKHEDCSPVMLNVATLGANHEELGLSYLKVKGLSKKAPVLSAVKTKLPVLHTFFGKDWTMK